MIPMGDVVVTNITNPYYAEKMKERGVEVDNLKIVEHFYIPSEKDLGKLSGFLKGCRTAVDVGSGYGLLVNELAKRNPEIEFLGIDTMYRDNNFPIPIAEKNVKFKFNGIEAMAYADKWNEKIPKFDCVMCCWMPHGSDWRKMLGMICNKKIILVLSKDFATGTPETYAGMKEFGFELEARWKSGKSIILVWR